MQVWRKDRTRRGTRAEARPRGYPPPHSHRLAVTKESVPLDPFSNIGYNNISHGKRRQLAILGVCGLKCKCCGVAIGGSFHFWKNRPKNIAQKLGGPLLKPEEKRAEARKSAANRQQTADRSAANHKTIPLETGYRCGTEGGAMVKYTQVSNG